MSNDHYVAIPVARNEDPNVNQLIASIIETLLKERIRADGAVAVAESVMIYLSRKCGISVTEVAEGLLKRARMTDNALQSPQMRQREHDELESFENEMHGGGRISSMKH